MIRTLNLCKSFGSLKALDNINIEIPPCSITALVGPNGAGKSTLMRILCQLCPPSDGEILYREKILMPDSPNYRRKIGFLQENPPFYGSMKVSEYIEFIAFIYSVPRDDAAKRGRDLLSILNLENCKDKRLKALSKGYVQRTLLAAAMIHEPEILILDEPFSGLDPNQIQDVRNLLVEKSKNNAILICTHNLSEVAQLCGRIIILNLGKVLVQNSLEKLIYGKKDLEQLFSELTRVQK